MVVLAAGMLKAQDTVSVGFHLVFMCIPGEYKKEALSLWLNRDMQSKKQ